MPARAASQAGVRLGMTVAQWPEPDRAAWQAAFLPASPFDPRPSGARVRPTTRIAWENSYARWLAWLQANHPESLLLAPAARVTEDRLLAYVHALTDEIALRTLNGYASRLQRSLQLIVPEADWAWMAPIIRRIERRARQCRSTKHPFVPSDQLSAFGIELMHEAETAEGQLHLDRAELYRDGLAIAFLAARPLRRANFIGLRLGEHVHETPGGYRVSIPGEQMKNNTALDFLLPDRLAPYLQRYLTDHRLILARGSGENKRVDVVPDAAFWLGRNGRPGSSDIFADMISRRTLARFGVRLTPHEFRHCAATSIAESSAAETHIIRIILGHTTGATAERHYIHASRKKAAQQYQNALLRRRKDGRGSF